MIHPAGSIGRLLREATEALALKLPEVDTRLEAGLLLCHSLDRPRAWLYAHPEAECPLPAYRRFLALLERRCAGEPMAYLLGHREFWSLELEVTPDTLIPRPETELLVELALEKLGGGGRVVRLLDLGTGSGAIAAAIARERPSWDITATDSSAAALEVARRNFDRLGLRNTRCLLGSWYAPLTPDSRFEAILSNPPYVARSDPHLLEGDLPWEPRQALSAGEDGLDAIREIISGARGFLVPRGWLLIEHGYDQGSDVRERLHRAGFDQLLTLNDLSGLERVSCGCLCPTSRG